MSNTPLTFIIGLALAAGLLGTGSSFQIRRPDADLPAEQQEQGLPESFRERLRKHYVMMSKLNKPVVLDKGLEKMTFEDAKQYFEDRFDMTILRSSKAFEHSEFAKFKVQLDKMSGVSLRTVLQLLVDQFHGALRVCQDHIEVTNPESVQPESWLRGDRALVPVVSAEFKEIGLNLALRDLTFQSGITIVLDEAAYQSVEEPAVTALLEGVCVDTAVELLASMCNLKSVALDRSLYVTTVLKANELEEQREARRLAREKPEETKSKKKKANRKKSQD